MALTEDQAREMERLLVLRILGDACKEYVAAAQELQQREEFLRYVMRRAESAGFSRDEIAAVTNLAPEAVAEALGTTDAPAGSGEAESEPTADEPSQEAEAEAPEQEAEAEAPEQEAEAALEADPEPESAGAEADPEPEPPRLTVVAASDPATPQEDEEDRELEDLAQVIGHLNVAFDEGTIDPDHADPTFGHVRHEQAKLAPVGVTDTGDVGVPDGGDRADAPVQVLGATGTEGGAEPRVSPWNGS